MQTTVPLFQASGINVSFGQRPVFSDLSFSVMPGEHLALVGRNGTGKSTLLRIISADMRLPHQPGLPDVFWGFSGALDPSALEPKAHVRMVSPAQQSVYVRQGWKVTGEEIVLSGFSGTPLLYDTPSKEELDAVQALADAAGLGILLDFEASAMSQGQLRAVLLMRALVGKPKLLLLDEPFDGLDKEARASLVTLMEMAAASGATLVVTAHRAEDIPPFITRICTPLKDRLSPVSPNTSKDDRPTPGEANLYPPAASGKTNDSPARTADAEFAALLKKQKSRAAELLPGNASVFRLEDVDVFIDRKKVLHRIHWAVQKGEHWAVTGRNGSGKSTLLRLLYGEEFVAFGGTISWFGKGRVTLSELHGLVGYVSDGLHHRYEHDLTAEGVVLSGIRGTIGLYDEPSPEERFMARQWMEKLGLTELAVIPYDALSSGQARRVLLARALAGAPPVLLLDEPFSGLDPESRTQFLGLLPLLASSGVQLVMVSHHTSDYGGIFTHQLALEDGRAVYSGPFRGKGGSAS